MPLFHFRTGGWSAIALAAAAAATVSCDRTGAADKPTLATTADTTQSPAGATASAAPAPSDAGALGPLQSPQPKAYATPEPQQLGTLPAGLGLAVGRIAPDFEVNDVDHRPLKLSTLAAGGKLLLFFYRGGW